MGKKNKRQDNPEPVEPSPQAKDELLEPERFDPALLEQPAALRQDYFEREVIIEHPHLDKALDAILDAICSPGDGPSLNRLGIMVLVIGPSRAPPPRTGRHGRSRGCCLIPLSFRMY